MIVEKYYKIKLTKGEVHSALQAYIKKHGPTIARVPEKYTSNLYSDGSACIEIDLLGEKEEV